MKRPGFWMGVLVGGVIMIPALALFFIGYQWAALPFTPFTALEWSARNLPGPLVTFGIDSMVGVLRALGLDVSDTAKLAEQTMSVGMTLVLAALVGGLAFVIMRRLRLATSATLPGAIMGALLGLALFLLQSTLPSSGNADALLTFTWTLGVMALWGLVVGFAFDRLTAPAPTAGAAVEGIDRRRFLVQMGGAAAVVTVTGAGVGALLYPRAADTTTALSLPEGTPAPEVIAALPNAGDPVEPAPGTRPEVTPVDDHYRIDIAMVPPSISPDGYTLPFTSALAGDKTTVKTYTLEALRADFEPIEAYITMSCVSNPIAGDLIGTTLWTGIPMQALLADVGIPEGASHLRITAADGFDETVALELIADDARVMLCYDWEGQPLTVEHGFPLRVHIPNHYGMKQPKWITEIEFLAADEDGYWVRRGWDKLALVKATSVIDTVAVESAFTEGEQTYIPVGGIAWAGDRGVSKVEVQVDGGEWVEARLRAPISDRTWTIWRYDWPFAEGAHTFTVRTTEGNGLPQIETVLGVRPSGATGLHEVRETV